MDAGGSGQANGGRLDRFRAAARRLLQRLAPHRWGLIVIGALAVIYLAMYVGTTYAHTPRGDGFYAWLYARSLVFDGDLHFKNDYQLCGDPWRNGVDRGTGRPDNPFYPGPSLFWAPALWLLKHVVPLAPGAPPQHVAGCAGTLTALTLGLGPLLGVLALAFAYLVARRFASDGQAALATGIVGAGGSIAGYAGVAPSYSHVYATVCAAAVLWTAIRAAEKPDSWRRWSVAALALFFCMLQRINFVSMALIPAALAVRGAWGRWPVLAARLGVLATGVILGAIPTLALYKYLYGSIFMLPQGRYYVQIGHGHPLLLLFAPMGGLFFQTPAMWLPVLGIPSGLRRERWLTGAMLATAAMEIYISSCPLTWDGGSSFGARLLTPLTPIFVVLAAFAVATVARWLAKGPSRAYAALGAALLVPLAFMTTGMLVGKHRPEGFAAFTQEGAYGSSVAGSWANVDQEIGDLAILPAEIAFSWRYGLPRQSFLRATYPRTFYRDYRTMQLSSEVLRLGDAAWTPLSRGFGERDKTGAKIADKLADKRAAVVFCAHWPYATRLSLAARANRPVRLKIGLGRFYGTLWLGEAALLPAVPADWPAFALPKGSFDSGINEIVLECEPGPCADAGVIVEAIRIHDDNTYAPALR